MRCLSLVNALGTLAKGLKQQVVDLILIILILKEVWLKVKLTESKLLLSSVMASKMNQCTDDRKLHCLFCYKRVSFEDGDYCGEMVETLKEKDKESRKRHVFNKFYSHVIIREGRRKVLCGVDEEGTNDKNFSVCDDCFYIIEGHSKLYEEIECLKLKLRWQLNKVRMIMKCAEKVPSRTKAFRDSFLMQDKNCIVLEDEELNNFNKALKLRRKFFGACVQRLKVKNPIVEITTLKSSGDNLIQDEDNINSDDDTAYEPQPGAELELETVPPPGSEINNENAAAIEHEAATVGRVDPSNLNVVHIFKTERGEIVTPPESVLDGIRSGNLEGTTGNHYFYSKILDTSQSLEGLFAEEYDGNSDFEGDLVGLPNNENEDRMGTAVQNVDESVKRKRKHPRTGERIAEHNAKMMRTTSNLTTGGTCSEITPKTSADINVVSEAVNKVLTGLRSIYKCPNCGMDFANETEFKNHVMSKDCFKKTKKGNDKGLTEENNSSDSEDDDLTSVSSTSPHSSDGDSDYAPTSNQKRLMNLKKSKVKRNKKSKTKHEVKRKCPEENCTKFFLYKHDLERHMEQHGFFACDFCRYTSDMAGSLVDHEIQHHSQANKTRNRENENSKRLQENKVVCPRCPNVLAHNKHHQTEHYMKTHLLPQGGTRN